MGVSIDEGPSKWLYTMENPIKMDDLGYPQETSKCPAVHVHIA